MQPREGGRSADEVALMMGAAHMLPLLAAVFAVANDTARRWLFTHGVLLEPAQSLWVLPMVGAGLDLVRIVVLAALLALVIAVPMLWLRSRRRTEE